MSGQAGRLVIRLAAVGFLVGVLLGQLLPALPSLAWGVLLLPLGWLAWRHPGPCLPLLFLMTGLLWSVFRAGLILSEQLPLVLEGADLHVEGRVAGLPVPTERGLRFAFDIEAARQGADPVAVPRRVQLSTYGPLPAAVEVGERWRFTVRLKRPRGFHNPGSFDYEAYLFQQRIRATGYVRERDPPQRLATAAEAGAHPLYALDRFRQRLSQRIAGLLPGNAFAPMITAFANGDDDSIADAHWEVLTRTGTGHLIAISGMNIGLVAGWMYFLVRWMWALPATWVLWLPAPRAAAIAALLAGTGYAALAGFAIPTQRALVMLAAGLIGVVLGRRTAPTVLLALALLAVLVFDPFAVLAPGFWLSFAAVAVILYVVRGAGGAGWRGWLLAFGRVQWAVTLGLLPFLLFIFQQASVASPLANLLAIPVVELVVIPATLIGVAALVVLPDALAVWPLALAATALEWLWQPLTLLARWPDALWAQPAPPPWALAAAAVGVALLLAPRGLPARWIGGLWLLPLLVVRPAAPAAGEMRVTLLDVGQGLSAVVHTARHTLVYDTGARFSARFDLGRAVVVPYLRHAGVRRVDVLIISHGDNDHIGGAGSLRAALPVGAMLSSVPERLGGEARACAAGQRWEWDGVGFEILHPPPGAAGSDNNASCVLRVDSRFGRVLLPGDIEARAERALMATDPAALRAEVLVVPHHGSRSSSSADFLARVQPRLALVPAGHRNRFQHPHPEVMARYREHGIETADTAAAGALRLRLDAHGPGLERQRERRRRYWHGQ